MDFPNRHVNGYVVLSDLALMGQAGIVAIPTTDTYIRHAAALRNAGLALVIADRNRFPGLDGSLTPVELLDSYPPRSHTPTKPILSFTDQFVDTTNAPLVVELGSAFEFRSSIEVVASARFRVPIRFLCGDQLSPELIVNHNDCLPRAMLDMSNYLDACERLGPSWLARPIQVERLHEHRSRNSALLKKHYASIVMASAIKSGPTHAHVRILHQLTPRAR